MSGCRLEYYAYRQTLRVICLNTTRDLVLKTMRDTMVHLNTATRRTFAFEMIIILTI